MISKQVNVKMRISGAKSMKLYPLAFDDKYIKYLFQYFRNSTSHEIKQGMIYISMKRHFFFKFALTFLFGLLLMLVLISK